MDELAIEGQWRDRVVTALRQSQFFGAMDDEQLAQIAGHATLLQYEAGEVVMQQGDPSDSFIFTLSGDLEVSILPAGRNEATVVGRLGRYDIAGEMGLLLDMPRSASVTASKRTFLLRFRKDFYPVMFQRFPKFALSMSRGLAERLHSADQDLPLGSYQEDGMPGATPSTGGGLMERLPVGFMQRHRVLPLKLENDTLVLGCVNNPSPGVMGGVRQHFPNVTVECKRIDASRFEQALSSLAGVEGWQGGEGQAAPAAQVGTGESKTPRLDALLTRMVEEGASDLHLTARERPRWRIDGEMRIIADAAPLGEEEVHELLLPVMEERHRVAYDETNDADFAHAIANVGRFRVNLFRDHLGSGAVFRHIRANILTLDQLFPPEPQKPGASKTEVPATADVLREMCLYPKGLVLVTGPTGSGKSTTLAAMVDHINKTKKHHIITLEDPIEFVHESRECLVNQREIGAHTKSFTRALKAALREDPDVVLVGEMRDIETVSLALETANTGHLVFGTLHTATAISTVDRIIGLFSADQQPQIRAALADSLKGVCAQTLCKRRGGGRVAALEILVVNNAVSHQIREAQTHQIINAMSTQRKAGNRLLNSSLIDLVIEGKIEADEAIAKAIEKDNMRKRIQEAAQSGSLRL